MKYVFRKANIEDISFILHANNEINKLSGLTDSSLEKNIINDLFKDKTCKSLIVGINGITIGVLLYSYVYWANYGKGIYLANAYVEKEYRQKGIFKLLLNELKKIETSSKFITNFVGKENNVMINSLYKMNFQVSDLDMYFKLLYNKKDL